MYGLLDETNAFHTAFSKKQDVEVELLYRNEHGYPVVLDDKEIKKQAKLFEKITSDIRVFA